MALVPWKLWLRVENVAVSRDYRLSDLLHPSLLGDRFDRLSYGAHRLPLFLFSPHRWLLVLPLMLVATFLVARRRPALAVLALAPVVAVPVGLLVTYWIGYPAVDWYVATTADRVPASGIVLAAVSCRCCWRKRRDGSTLTVMGGDARGARRDSCLRSRCCSTSKVHCFRPRGCRWRRPPCCSTRAAAEARSRRTGSFNPLVLAPAARSLDPPTAYGVAKALSAVLWALIAVPAYLLARRRLAPRASLVVAALSVLAPASVYATAAVPDALALLLAAGSLPLLLRAAGESQRT